MHRTWSQHWAWLPRPQQLLLALEAAPQARRRLRPARSRPAWAWGLWAARRCLRLAAAAPLSLAVAT
jgi:hypothetical protein